MEFAKVSSFVDFEALEGQASRFEGLVDSLVAKIKNVGALEIKLQGADGSKEVIKGMSDLGKATKDLETETRKYEKSVQDAAKADREAAKSAKELEATKKTQAITAKANAQASLAEAKAIKELYNADIAAAKAKKEGNAADLLAARTSKENAQTKLVEARAIQQLYKAEVEEARIKTETARATAIQQKIEITANREKDRQQSLADKAAKNLAKESDAYERLKKSYNAAAAEAKRLAVEKGFDNAETIKAIALAQNYYLQLIKVEEAVGQSQRKVGQYTQATFALTQVLREAPAFANSFATGISAISNNVPMLVDQFKLLRTELGSGFAAFKVLAGSLLSFQAILPIAFLLIQAYGKDIANFFSGLFSGAKAFDTLRESQKLLNKAFADSSYKDAVKNVRELEITIGLAKKGFLDKDQVLKHYNDTLGNTLGKAKNLNEAEQLLVKNGEAYIKMTLYKAAANLALEQAAQKAIDAAQRNLNQSREDKIIERTDKSSSVPKKALAAYKKAYDAYSADIVKYTLEKDTENAAFAEENRNNLEKRFNAKFFATKDEIAGKQLESIAADFFKQAAIAGKGLDFFETKDPKAAVEKAQEDYLKGLQKQKEDALKLANELTRLRLQGQANELQAAAEDLKKDFTVRYSYYLAYYEKLQELAKFNTKAELEEAKAKTDEEKRQVQAKLDDPKAKLSIQQRKDLTDTLAAIDDKAAKEAEVIALKGNQALLAIDNDYNAKLIADAKAAGDKILADRIEALEKLKAAFQTSLKNDTNKNDTKRDTALSGLAAEFEAGLLSVTEYNRRKLAITKAYAKEDLDIQINSLTKLLVATTDSEEERLDIEARLAALRLKKDTEITDEKINNLEKLKNKQKELAAEGFETFKAIVLGRYDEEKNQIQGLIDKLEDKKLADIKAAQTTSATAQEAADRVSAINIRAAAEKEQLERRKRQIDQDRARFEKAANIAKIIADTAAAVIAQLKETPLPAGGPLAFAIGAIGALQLARVVATPIPKYKDGLGEAKTDHLAITGDGGKREVVVYPDGTGYITPDKPTYTWIPKGASVLPDINQLSTVYSHMAPGFQHVQHDSGLKEFAQQFKREGRLTREAIKNKKETYLSFKNGSISMTTKDGYNETIYLNENLGF